MYMYVPDCLYGLDVKGLNSIHSAAMVVAASAAGCIMWYYVIGTVQERF